MPDLARRALRVAALGLSLLLAACLAEPRAAWAAPSAPVLTLDGHRDDERVIEFSATAPEGGTRLVLVRDSEELTAVACVPSETVSLVATMPAEASSFTVRALDVSGSPLADSAPVEVLARDLRPVWLSLDLTPGRLVVDGQRAYASVRGARTVKASLYSYRDDGSVSAPVARSGGVTRVILPGSYGRVVLNLSAANAWGASWKCVTLWHLDVAPGSERWVLVDKSDFSLYRITGERVYRAFPVAIGMAATPTRTGTFTLGRPQRSSGVWGPWRIPLLARTRWGPRATSYYVHGNNDPESIGTEASHGCVRMYNSDIRSMLDLTWPGMRAVIRP